MISSLGRIAQRVATEFGTKRGFCTVSRHTSALVFWSCHHQMDFFESFFFSPPNLAERHVPDPKQEGGPFLRWQGAWHSGRLGGETKIKIKKEAFLCRLGDPFSPKDSAGWCIFFRLRRDLGQHLAGTSDYWEV